MPITSTLFTTVLAARRRALGCEEISNLLLTSFPKPSTDARRVVFVMLRSVHGHFTYGEHDLVPDFMLSELAAHSDLVMALARRLEVNLRNGQWAGDLAEDVRSMYLRAFNKLVTFLLDAAGGSLKAAVEAVQSTYYANVRYLLNVPDWMVEHNIATTAKKYDVAYVNTATIEDLGLGTPEGSQGQIRSPEPAVCKGLLVKIKAGLKRKLRGKELVEGGAGETAKRSAVTLGYAVSGSESGGDSGVSVCGSDEVCGQWWSDEE